MRREAPRYGTDIPMTKAATMIRPVEAADLPALKAVIDATGLFPSGLLDEMISSYLGATDQSELWLTYDSAGPAAIAYCAPEQMTEGTWNLYLIAVHPDHQGKSIGSALLKFIEDRLAAQGERILLVETSGLEGFERTRAFYRKCGFHEEARIREFYQAGEDKIVFRKVLAESA